MTTTTILNDDSATIVSDETAPSRFNWTAAFAGALVATAVNLFLITLGAGVGLALVSAPGTTTPTFLTLGAVYFLAAQAFGFAVGGHLAGRLIGPAIETNKEEDFRACSHGMLVWSLGVVATAGMVALSTVVAGSSLAHGTIIAASTPATSQSANGDITGYWVDMLFRPANQARASLEGLRYAQDVPNNDASPAPLPAEVAPSGPPQPLQNSTPVMPSGSTPVPTVTTTLIPPATDTQSIAADKAEAGRILARDMLKGSDSLSADDRNHLAQMVSTRTGMPFAQAAERVNDVQGRIRDDMRQTAEIARKAASYASLWTAFALLFGAVVCVFATLSARWQDDKVSFRLAPR